MATKYNWQWVASYEAVLFEADERKLPARIAIATEEMQLRLRQLRRRTDEYERQHLLYALNNVGIVKRSRQMQRENYRQAF